MRNDFDNKILHLEREILALKQAKLKWAGVIAMADNSLSATFTITELDYDLFSSQALYITAENENGDSFLSDLLFTGPWDGRGWAKTKIYESKGKIQWCLAMVVPTADDYTRYYGPDYSQANPFNVDLNFIVRTSSAVNITTTWGDNPYASVW